MSHQKSVLTWNTHSARSDIAHSPHCPSCDMWFDLVMSQPWAYGPRVRHHSVKSHVALGTVRTESDVASVWVRVSAINTLFRCDIPPRCRTLMMRVLGGCRIQICGISEIKGATSQMSHPFECNIWDVAPHWEVALESVRTRTHLQMSHPKVVKLSLAHILKFKILQP